LGSAFAAFYLDDVECLVPGLLFLVWKAIPDAKWPKWLTGASFGIYAAHPFFTRFLDEVIFFSWGDLGADTKCMLRLFVSLAGCLIGIWLTKRFCPRAAKVLLGRA